MTTTPPPWLNFEKTLSWRQSDTRYRIVTVGFNTSFRPIYLLLNCETAFLKPPMTTKLKIYPSDILQNPPNCTKQKSQGACPQTPLTCVCYLLNAKYKFKQFFLQGVQLTYFENTPAIQNSTPPSKISGHGPVKTMTLKRGTSSTSVPSGSSLFYHWHFPM